MSLQLSTVVLFAVVLLVPTVGNTAEQATDAQAFRDTHSSLPAFADYQSRRLQLVTPKLRWMGPEALGYPPRQLKANKTHPFRVIRLSEPERTLTLPELVRTLGDRDFAFTHGHLVARQEAKVRRGGPMVGVGLAVLSVGITGVVLAASSGGFGPLASVGIPMGSIGLGVGIPVLSVGAALHAGGSLNRRLLQKSDAVELYYDRDDVWNAVDQHNSRLRRKLQLPDDSRLDAPSESDL